MSVFVDTSALFAALSRKDQNHTAAVRGWRRLLGEGVPLISTSYVAVETVALVQNRLGLDAVRDLQQNLIPFVTIHWVDAEVHTAGVTALLAINRRPVSLVDCVSFVIMRRLGIEEAFAFDEHFTEQGFRLAQ